MLYIPKNNAGNADNQTITITLCISSESLTWIGFTVLVEVETCTPLVGCTIETVMDQDATKVLRNAEPLGRFVGFDFYYKDENGSWIREKIGFIQKSSTFYSDEDGYYQFKIVGNDLAGNKGFDITNIILVDTEGPNVNISGIH